MDFFDWNLSSDEEDGFDDDCTGLQEQSNVSINNFAAKQQTEDSKDDEDSDVERNNGSTTVAFFSEDEEESAIEEDEEEEIDWEDGEDDDKKPAAEPTKLMTQLKPVTVEWKGPNAKESIKTSKRKRVARKSYRFDRLPLDLQHFLTTLEKSHLLCYTAHALIASTYCSNQDVLHVSHSLIPLAWTEDYKSKERGNKNAPSVQDLSHFCNFFFNLIRRRPIPPSRYARRRTNGKKKKAASATVNGSNNVFEHLSTISYRTLEYCSHLSKQMQNQYDSNGSDTTFNSYDDVHLLIAMARSLGWRARFVIAFEPIKKDMDVNHPLFAAMKTRNVFQRIWKENEKELNKKKNFKRQKITLSDDGKVVSKVPSITPMTIQVDDSMSRPVCWVEILCETKSVQDSASSSAKLNWICVDPRLELVNQPKLVESILYAHQNHVPFKSVKRKLPITYALAAEHIPYGDSTLVTRLVDVTPRYASSWTKSLKMRGVLRGKQTRVKESERVDRWWSTVLKSINSGEKHKRDNLRKTLLEFKGTSTEDAIVLDEDDHSTKSLDQDTERNTLKEADDHEAKELEASRKEEPIPTSKTAFKSHPIYVIPSVLNSNEVLVPEAKKRFCGFFKGEPVFRRTDVECALPLKRWLYKGRKVKETEVNKPIKRVKARKKASKGFKALKSYGIGADNDGGEEYRLKQIDAASRPLEDGKENLYASWQTDPWSPSPVGPNDVIPVNEHNNIELELINPGLVHIDLKGVAKLAKQFGM